MSTFINTETVYSTSGVSNLWLRTPISYNQIRNSGGIVNVAGPVILHSIIPVYASGQSTAASLSGVNFVVNHARSGMVGLLSGEGLLIFAPGAQSGLVNGMSFIPPPQIGMNYLCRSGIATANSGTHVIDLILTYSNPQV